jgi:hypothetical protein
VVTASAGTVKSSNVPALADDTVVVAAWEHDPDPVPITGNPFGLRGTVAATLLKLTWSTDAVARNAGIEVLDLIDTLRKDDAMFLFDRMALLHRPPWRVLLTRPCGRC